MAKMLSGRDVAIRATETGQHPDVYCGACQGWVAWGDLHDGEHCPRCRAQIEEAKAYKLGLAVLSEQDVARAEAVWRKSQRDPRAPEEPADAQPVLKYGNQVLHAPQTSAPGSHA